MNWTKWLAVLPRKGFRWVNGITGQPAFFCSRFCAAKFEVRWIEPIEERPRCMVCGH